MAEEKSSDTEVVKTLHITGLPMDVKHRELHNLLRFLNGFESAVVAAKPGSYSYGFAVFKDQPTALEARDKIQGLIFDEDAPAVPLQVELAKANSAVKKRARDTLVSTAPYNPFSTNPPIRIEMQDKRARVAGGSKQPITTLFLANLSKSAAEREVRDLFALLPGFRKIKWNSTPGRAPVAFVDFVDVTSAQHALTVYQGYQVPSADSGGLRIEFAKKQMHPLEGEGVSNSVPSMEGVPAVGYGYVDPYGAAAAAAAAASAYSASAAAVAATSNGGLHPPGEPSVVGANYYPRQDALRLYPPSFGRGSYPHAQ